MPLTATVETIRNAVLPHDEHALSRRLLDAQCAITNDAGRIRQIIAERPDQRATMCAALSHVVLLAEVAADRARLMLQEAPKR